MMHPILCLLLCLDIALYVNMNFIFKDVYISLKPGPFASLLVIIYLDFVLYVFFDFDANQILMIQSNSDALYVILIQSLFSFFFFLSYTLPNRCGCIFPYNKDHARCISERYGINI